MADSNCDDAYNIEEGDRVQVATTDGHSFDLTCTDYTSHNARDPDVVEETRTWTFKTDDGEEFMLQRVDGLRRFEWQEEYPYERPLAQTEPSDGNELETFGYIESVNIMGAEV